MSAPAVCLVTPACSARSVTLIPSGLNLCTMRHCATVRSSNPAARSASMIWVSAARCAMNSSVAVLGRSVTPLTLVRFPVYIRQGTLLLRGAGMDTDEIWRHIDQQRADLADFLDTLTDEQWA